jgi:hypothetical protein
MSSSNQDPPVNWQKKRIFRKSHCITNCTWIILKEWASYHGNLTRNEWEMRESVAESKSCPNWEFFGRTFGSDISCKQFLNIYKWLKWPFSLQVSVNIKQMFSLNSWIVNSRPTCLCPPIWPWELGFWSSNAGPTQSLSCTQFDVNSGHLGFQASHTPWWQGGQFKSHEGVSTSECHVVLVPEIICIQWGQGGRVLDPTATVLIPL